MPSGRDEEPHIRVLERATNDTRVLRVAKRLQLSRFDVLGRLTLLWLLCKQRGSEHVDLLDAEIATGDLPGFMSALVTEGLADMSDQSTVRVRGAESELHRIEREAERRRRVSEGNSIKGVKSGFTRREKSAGLRNQAAVQPVFEPQLNRSAIPERRDLQNKNALLPRNTQSAFEFDSGIGSASLPGPAPQNAATGIPDAKSEPRKTPEIPPQAIQLASELLTHVTLNHPSGRLARSAPRLKEQTITRWANTIRLINQQDKIEWAEIATLIEWSQKHDWWKSRILGADNLRQHWDTLDAQRRRDNAKRDYSAVQTARRQLYEPRPGPTELARREVEQLEAQAAGAARSKP